jgi:hypothetical protein
MRAQLASLLAVVLLAAPAAAQERADAAPERADAAPERADAAPERADTATAALVVLVIDTGTVRINPERLRRAVESSLGRAVVRITDPRARHATTTLVIAHEEGTRWLLRYEGEGAVGTGRAEVARPGLYDVALASAARRVVAGAVRAVAATPAASGSSPPALAEAAPARRPELLATGWSHEILDPFVNVPWPSGRLAMASEVLDPFTPPSTHPARFSEVLDPWGR